jgi:hypothetical protein
MSEKEIASLLRDNEAGLERLYDQLRLDAAAREQQHKALIGEVRALRDDLEGIADLARFVVDRLESKAK